MDDELPPGVWHALMWDKMASLAEFSPIDPIYLISQIPVIRVSGTWSPIGKHVCTSSYVFIHLFAG